MADGGPNLRGNEVNLTPDHVEKVLCLIGFSSGLPDRRRGFATELARDGITEQHLDALTWRCLEAKSPGGMCDTILKAGWRKELDPLVRAKDAEKADDPASKRRAEDEAALRQRAEWNGVGIEQQRVEDRRSKVWELLNRSHWSPAQIAEHMGGTVDDVLADLAARGATFGRTLEQVLETSDPESIKRNLDRMRRQQASRQRAEAAREIEPLKLLDQAEPKPAPSHVPGPQLPFTTAEIEAAAERSREFRERHLAMTDRAWCERFGRTLKIIDPDLHSRLMAGPDPEVWIRQRVCAPIENLFREVRADLKRKTSTEGLERAGRRR